MYKCGISHCHVWLPEGMWLSIVYHKEHIQQHFSIRKLISVMEPWGEKYSTDYPYSVWFYSTFFQIECRETYVRGTPIPFTADPSAFITRLDPTEQRRPQTKPLSGPVAEELPTISSQMVWTIWVISFRCLEYVEIASKKHIIFNIGHHPVLSFTCCAY